ncbi:MAG: DUF456 domain-containing protein [Candidatus Kerfeldbacteria bacterium]|nr:DUF456 domain-containing protein [Candidatus Kerfeldbacteria bacterium]
MNLANLGVILSFLLVAGGLLAIVFPFAPSIPTIWFGIFLYGLTHGYVAVSENFMVLISAIAVATIVLDYTLSRSGVQPLRADAWGVIGAVVGGLVGSIFGPISTYLVGPLVGAIVLELFRGRDRVYSYQSGNYTIVAFMGGTLVKLLAAIAMIGLFILRIQGKL